MSVYVYVHVCMCPSVFGTQEHIPLPSRLTHTAVTIKQTLAKTGPMLWVCVVPTYL